jgi:hypothetical protein
MCVCVNEENKDSLSAREEKAHHQARHQGILQSMWILRQPSGDPYAL